MAEKIHYSAYDINFSPLLADGKVISDYIIAKYSSLLFLVTDTKNVPFPYSLAIDCR
jgi:hypothetical protein